MKINCRDRDKLFQIWSPTSWLKRPFPLDVNFHWAQGIKRDYNQMEQIKLSDQTKHSNVKFGLLLLEAIRQENRKQALR